MKVFKGGSWKWMTVDDGGLSNKGIKAREGEKCQNREEN